MFLHILQFLADNKVVIVGATATILEVVASIINFRRHIAAQKSDVKLLSYNGESNVSYIKSMLWAIQPWNLLRSPK